MRKAIHEILLIEDEPADVNLMKEALTEAQLAVHLSVVSDGVAALAYLRKMEPYSEVQRPDLIILDLNLPKKDGRTVLQEIKNDANLKPIPVIILSASVSEVDIWKSYSLGASCYINKPLRYEEWLNTVRLLNEFWFKVVKLPPSPQGESKSWYSI